ncbi:hypothetical protein [Rhodococcus ruber]|uniref:hypothetical protein n=1 Tax=Rhodococcus ruber TaxID=1830 RepID=UPI001F2B1C7B|nr:hypothetical protein [Rhodococcus ruber]MCF8783214.1 hypothetical protein [Rhodococcus ruber]
MTPQPQAKSEDELREQTRRSIARLISIQRGDETWNNDDYTTAGNILFVCSRLIRTEAEAHADRVIGEDVPVENYGSWEEGHRMAGRNDLRAEQRSRNHYPLKGGE